MQKFDFPDMVIFTRNNICGISPENYVLCSFELEKDPIFRICAIRMDLTKNYGLCPISNYIKINSWDTCRSLDFLDSFFIVQIFSWAVFIVWHSYKMRLRLLLSLFSDLSPPTLLTIIIIVEYNFFWKFKNFKNGTKFGE